MAISLHDMGGSPSARSWWPGLHAPSDRDAMDPDRVRELADELRSLVSELDSNSAGTPEDLHERSSVVTGDNSFGRWDTGTALRDSYLEAYQGVADGYTVLRQQLAAAAEALDAAADEFEGVDRSLSADLEQQLPTGAGYQDRPI